VSGRALLAFAGAIGLFVPTLAHGQRCPPPPPPATAASSDQILVASQSAFDRLKAERAAAAAQRTAAQQDRINAFRRVSAMHWRWVCDYLGLLASHMELRARAATREMILLDLGGERKAARDWLATANLVVQKLRENGTAIPRYGDVAIDQILQSAAASFANGVKLDSYFTIDDPR